MHWAWRGRGSPAPLEHDGLGSRGWRELRARASSAGARLSVVFFLRARYIFASFVFIE